MSARIPPAKERADKAVRAPFAPLKLYGQESTPTTWAMANMNMIIHDMEGQIEIGDTFRHPKFRKGHRLQTFDRAVANPMWNQTEFTEKDYDADELDRFPKGAGFPGNKADWGWVQHILASLGDTGRAAIVLDTGAASRGSGNANTNKEKEVRRWFVEQDLIEGVIYLPENLFYNTTAPGIILDFVGIFDKLEKALAFDSDEINAIVKDIGLLKHLFKAKMETKAPAYMALVTRNFDDKDVDNLIEHFRDKERRKEFFKEYKEIEMLYEIISPDAFLRPFIDPYTTLSSIYAVVRNAYAKKVYVDRAFQKKTNELVQRHIGATLGEQSGEYITIDRSTIETIKQRLEGKATKVVNLVKAIEKTAEENSDDPFLVALSERAKVVQESFEDRQISTANALAELLKEIDKNEQRKQEQAARGLDGLTYFVLCKLTDDGIPNPEPVSKKVREAFARYPNWQRSEAELRELRKQVTFAVFAEEDDMEKVTATVEALFTLLHRSFRP